MFSWFYDSVVPITCSLVQLYYGSGSMVVLLTGSQGLMTYSIYGLLALWVNDLLFPVVQLFSGLLILWV